MYRRKHNEKWIGRESILTRRSHQRNLTMSLLDSRSRFRDKAEKQCIAGRSNLEKGRWKGCSRWIELEEWARQKAKYSYWKLYKKCKYHILHQWTTSKKDEEITRQGLDSIYFNKQLGLGPFQLLNRFVTTRKFFY